MVRGQLGEARALLEQVGDGSRQRRVLVNLGIVQVIPISYLSYLLFFLHPNVTIDYLFLVNK